MTRSRLTFAALAVSGLLAACGGEPEAPPTTPDVPATASPDVRFDLADLKAKAQPAMLVPGPLETQRALAGAGLTTRLGALVSARSVVVDVEDRDELAVRTGLAMAQLALCLESADNAEILVRLGKLRSGLAALGAGERVTSSIDQLGERIGNGAIAASDLPREMDDLTGLLLPEVTADLDERVLPLVQAGAWLEGAHLVARAIEAEGRADVAGRLLQQPDVVSYFLGYLDGEGATAAPAELVGQLRETLTRLLALTSKPALTAEDVAEVRSLTGAVLAQVGE